MNDLCEKFSDKLVVLAFPSNQFGHQENSGGEEILRSLEHVRPGNGFKPKAIMFDKVDVNGGNEHPLFTLLKKSLPTPHDDEESLMSDPKHIIWTPVKRSDISWNFEKFLISADGKPVKRYSRHFLTSDISKDIESLL